MQQFSENQEVKAMKKSLVILMTAVLLVLMLPPLGQRVFAAEYTVTWDPNGGLPFDEAAKQEIFEQLEHSYISGITFSGGDPLHPANRTDVRNLMEEIKTKYPDKTIWLYTGDSWENIMHYPLMKYVDVVVDGEFHIEERDVKLMWKGSKNQRVIDVQKSLRQTDPGIPILHCGDYE